MSLTTKMLHQSQWMQVVPSMTETCKDCGCTCTSCHSGNNLDLHREIEELRSKLLNSQTHVSQMERDFVESRQYSESEINKLQDELTKLRDRYERLFESHKKLQKLNHTLEDRLLTVVTKYETEKVALQQEVSSLGTSLRDARILICDLEEECEKYRTDCNTAVQLLQCKPSNFVAHRLNTLPVDLQQRVSSHLTKQQMSEVDDTPSPPSPRMIRVPMPTFPPTAMVYSIGKLAETQTPPAPPESKSERLDAIPTSVIAKVLTQPETHRKPRHVYICDKCHTDHLFQDQETQTTCGVSVETFQRGSGAGLSRTPQSVILIQPSVHTSRSNSESDM